MLVRLVLWNLADSQTNIGEAATLPPRRVGRRVRRVEATIEGRYADEALSRLGLAFE